MPLFLIPGFMLNCDLWADMEPALAPYGPLIHPDPAAGDSIEAMASLTLKAAPERFALVGFSMGGYVAREIVRRAPERVTQLVLVATSSRGDTEGQSRRKAAAISAAAVSFSGVARQSIRQALAPSREQDDALVERIHAMSEQLGGEAFLRQASMPRLGDANRLGEIRCPTLVVAGREDRLRSLEEAEELHVGIPGSRLVVLEAGHMIPLEAPEALSAAMLEFLGRSKMAHEA